MWELFKIAFLPRVRRMLSSLSEGVELLNSAPHPLWSEPCTAAPIRMGHMGHQVRSTQAGQAAVRSFEADV